MTSPDRDGVLCHDFRPPEFGLAAGRPESVPRNPTRMLALAWTSQLLSLHELFMDRSARLSVLCVAVGGPDPDPGASPLVAPAVLANPGMATLWVVDEEGKGSDWSPDPDALAPAGPLLDPGTTALDQLVECLKLPDVFDAVFARLTALPSHIASPGLRLRSGKVPASRLRAAREMAVESVLGPAGQPGAGQSPDLAGGPVVEVLARAGAAAGELDPIRAGSPLDRRREGARQAYGRATALLAALPAASRLLGRRRPGRHVWPALTAASAELDAYHAALAQVLDQGHRAGDDGGGADRLARLGVQLPTELPVDRADLLDGIGSAVSEALGRQPAVELEAWLRGLADWAEPQGSAAYLPRLAALRQSPEQAVLDRPAAFPLRLLSPVVLAGAAVGTFLAGTAGWAVAVVAGLGWLLGGWLLIARQPTKTGERGWRGRLSPVLLGQVGAVTLGGGLGTVAGAQLALPGPVGIGLALLAVALLVATLRHWWVVAARDWAGGLGLSPPTDAIAGYDRLLAQVAAAEWRLADERHFLANVALLLAGALRQAADGLRAPDPAGGLSLEPALGGIRPDRALVALLAEDITDLLQALLDRCRELLADGDTPDVEWVGGELAALLRVHRVHLEHKDVHERPPFSRRGPRAMRVDGGWGSSEGLVEVMLTPAEGQLVQLCADRHRGLLARTGLELVRFAPRAVAEPLAAELTQRQAGAVAGQVTWTSSGALAGVLRLVPLRAGAVRLTWPTNEEEQDEL